MMGYVEFQRLMKADNADIHINKQYDSPTLNKSGKMTKHELGLNIRAKETGKPIQYGILHFHWAPKDGPAEININISAHFKDTHASQKTSGKNNKNEIPRPDDNLLYNSIVLLAPLWTSHGSAQSRPATASTGWTQYKGARISKAMVEDFRRFNANAALGKDALNMHHDLSQWENDAWDAYLKWMTPAK
jgi:hypothetical protein